MRPRPPELPPALVALARDARRVLEVGAGADFSTALAIKAAAPETEVIVSDVDDRVLLAPLALESLILDVTHADVGGIGDIDLVVAVRLPEELQLPVARLANALRAGLAVRTLKDEWADVSEARRRFEVWPGGWRYYPA